MSKKRIVYSLVLVLLFNFLGPTIVSAKISDVPTDHWAYYAVNNAINKGYLTVFEDGRFKGTNAVDRFTLATVINLLLEEIQVVQVKGTTGDLSLIRELSSDFEGKLASWYAAEEGIRTDLQRSKDDAVIAGERVNRVVEAQMEVQEQVEELARQLQMLHSNIGEVQLGVKDVREDIGTQFWGLTEQENLLGQLESAIIEIDKVLHSQKEVIQGQEKDIYSLGLSLENLREENRAAFAGLQLTDNSLVKDIEMLHELLGELNGTFIALRERNYELEDDIRNLSILIQRESQKVADLTAELGETRENIEYVRDDVIILREDRTLLDDLRKELDVDVKAQMNAALIREQRLERQIKEIEEEFADYKIEAEKNTKSAKTLATLAVALGAIGVAIGFIKIGGN